MGDFSWDTVFLMACAFIVILPSLAAIGVLWLMKRHHKRYTSV